MITAFAEGTAAANTAGGVGGSLISLIITFLPMILIFYFLIIRPQKKQQKKVIEMLAGLQIGDKIVTIGGIVGKITRIKDDEVLVETGIGNEKSVIKFQKAAISSVLTIHE